jgi:hypothetical protein
MDIQFMFHKIKMFCPLFPTHPSSYFCFFTHIWNIYVGAKGELSLSIIRSFRTPRRIFRCWEMSWSCGGTTSHFGHPPLFYIIIKCNAFNFEDWGQFVTLAQNAHDRKNLGTRYWPNNYKRWSVGNMTVIIKLYWMFYQQFERFRWIERTKGLNYIRI